MIHIEYLKINIVDMNNNNDVTKENITFLMVANIFSSSARTSREENQYLCVLIYFTQLK